MLLDPAIKLVSRLIYSGAQHKDYKRTVELAKDYKIFITGKGIDSKLIQFVQREDADLFAQRVRLTKSTTPAVASSIRQPFNKVTRNDRIRKTIKLENESKQQAVLKMMASFYGAPQKKNRGLEYWLKTRFLEMQFTDPNSWVVVEWDAPKTPAEVISPRPFEVSAEQAINFFSVNDVVKWLLVKQAISFYVVSPDATDISTAANPEEKEPAKKTGFRYTLYDEDVSVVFEQVDIAYLTKTGYKLAPNEGFKKIGEIDYLVKTYTPNIGYVPAFRIGYKRDEETDGRTFVNPWHDSLCYFEKSLKTVSELDLTMVLHTFPQKLQYVQKCPGVPAGEGKARRGCNQGFIQGTLNEVCTQCSGKGYKLHTTAQDSILIPMPSDPKNDDIIDLEKLIVYKTPPIDLIKFQNEYAQQLERQAHVAVFNSQAFVSKSGGGITEQITATESDYNMQSVYDALEPFTEKYSEVWKDFVTLFAVICNETLDKIDVSHDFPADYKLKTGDILLNERKAATDSGAPAFLIETIDDDLAKIIFAGDTLGLQKYQVKRRYFPFSGKKDDEIALLLASEFVPEEAKVLYCNFEQIFKELAAEDPGFWTLQSVDEQATRVSDKVTAWIEKLNAAKPAPVFNMFKPAATDPAATDPAAAGNPGNNNPQQ